MSVDGGIAGCAEILGELLLATFGTPQEAASPDP